MYSQFMMHGQKNIKFCHSCARPCELSRNNLWFTGLVLWLIWQRWVCGCTGCTALSRRARICQMCVFQYTDWRLSTLETEFTAPFGETLAHTVPALK